MDDACGVWSMRHSLRLNDASNSSLGGSVLAMFRTVVLIGASMLPMRTIESREGSYLVSGKVDCRCRCLVLALA